MYSFTSQQTVAALYMFGSAKLIFQLCSTMISIKQLFLNHFHSIHYHRASACYACRARYCFSKSVLQSIRHTVLLYRQSRMHIISSTFLHCLVSVWPSTAVTKIHGNYLSRHVSTRGWELNLRFSIEIAVCLKRYELGPCGYCGPIIGSHR